MGNIESKITIMQFTEYYRPGIAYLQQECRLNDNKRDGGDTTFYVEV